MNESYRDMYELRVLNGLHQGAALPLVGDRWSIGADKSLDLSLQDTGIELIHCQLQRDGEHWSVISRDGKVLDSEGHPFSELRPNTQFALGSVWVCLANANEPWPNVPVPVTGDEGTVVSGEKKSPIQNAVKGNRVGRGACITLGVLLGVVGSTWSLSPSILSSKEVPVETAPTLHVQDMRKIIDAQTAASLLKTMLSERMLNTVIIEQNAKGLTLTGALKPESMVVYNRMLKRFNTEHRLEFVLENRVSSATSGLPFAITQIIGGRNGHLVMSDGRRMYIGDRIDGLRLVQIENGRIQFDGERRMEVVW